MRAPFVQPDAAAIDIDAADIFGAVPPAQDTKAIQCFEADE